MPRSCEGNDYSKMIQNINVTLDLGREELFELGRHGPWYSPEETRKFLGADKYQPVLESIYTGLGIPSGVLEDARREQSYTTDPARPRHE